MKTRAMIAALSVLIALPAAAQEMFFYPSQGQSPEQQTRDLAVRGSNPFGRAST
jgi:hypothetical protein